jgi:hypothetical protein
MRQFMRGCASFDPQLVNFQQKLVTKTDIERDDNDNPILDALDDRVLKQDSDGKETALQFLLGGAVARVRPRDQKTLTVLSPNETRSFGYRMNLAVTRGERLRVQARLMFRPLPPYFVRALEAGKAAGDPDLRSIPAILPVDEIARSESEARRN